jgi:phenylacetate-CoA ligase
MKSQSNNVYVSLSNDPSRRRGEKKALDLFHVAATRIPAYKDFLTKANIVHEKIKTYEDFTKYVPLTDKKNYITQYPLAQLCLDGDIFHNSVISVSSGSTGEPFFWPRGPLQDKDNTELLRRIYDYLEMNRKKTLLVLCFSMGTWAAGTIMAIASINYSDKGNPVSVLTPGIEKTGAISAIKKLAADYEQVVVGGYPPFAKDVIEEGRRGGINWAKLSTKLMMSGEAFSEEWRDYILGKVASKDPFYGSANVYGAADVGIIGYETPLSILLRRTYNKAPAAMKQFFGTEILPSLLQFDPLKRHLEIQNEELIVTSNSGIPLIRYNLKDTGGIVSVDEAIAPIHDKVMIGAARHGIDTKAWDYPLVYLNGRKDFTITIYGLNVYPENIKAALIDRRVRLTATGRFTMAAVSDKDMNQTFELNVELAQEVVARPEDQDIIERVVLEKLIKLNSEFRKLYEVMGDKVRPHVHLIQFGDPNYFARGVKHKWAKKGD